MELPSCTGRKGRRACQERRQAPSEVKGFPRAGCFMCTGGTRTRPAPPGQHRPIIYFTFADSFYLTHKLAMLFDYCAQHATTAEGSDATSTSCQRTSARPSRSTTSAKGIAKQDVPHHGHHTDTTSTLPRCPTHDQGLVDRTAVIREPTRTGARDQLRDSDRTFSTTTAPTTSGHQARHSCPPNHDHG